MGRKRLPGKAAKEREQQDKTASERGIPEMRRIYWYDILLYLTMMTEVTYREYEDDGQYQWSKSLFEEVWSLLQK